MFARPPQPPQPNNTSTATNPVGRFMVAVGAVIEQAGTGKILVIQRSADQDWHPNEWEIGYGRIDQFEDPITGLKREVFEEIGLKDFEVGQLLSVWHIFRGPEKAENELVGMTFHCITKEEKIKLSSEHSTYKWVEPTEALSLIKVEGIRRDVTKFIELKKAVPKVKVGKDVIGVGAGALILNAEGKMLLAQRGPKAKNERGKWEIPGGAIEFGETVAAGLVREIKEELGIEIEVGELLELCDHVIVDEQQHWVSPTYFCTIKAGTPTIKEPEKCAAIGWFSLAEAERMPLSLVTQADVQVLRQRQMK